MMWYTTKEAAEILGVTRKTTWRWGRNYLDGLDKKVCLPARVGEDQKTLYFDESDLTVFREKYADLLESISLSK